MSGPTAETLAGRQLSTAKLRFGQSIYLRRFNALLLALNLALLVTPVVSQRMHYPVLMIGRRIRYFIYAHWPLLIPTALRAAEPYRMDFATLVLASSCLFFVFFLVTAHLRLVANQLRLIPGIVAVEGLPFVIGPFMGFSFVLYIQPVAAAACLLLHLFGRWRLPSLVSILLLVSHFAFWFWGTAWTWQIWFWPAYPLVGFFLCCGLGRLWKGAGT